MSYASSTIVEIRSSGSPTNGGGFSPAYGGVDYSQQDSPVATGTVTSSGTTVTATTSIFTSAMKGNFIADGTGTAAGTKQITAYSSPTVVTVDSAPSWTSAAVSVGGGISDLQKGINLLNVLGIGAYVRGSFSLSTGITLPSGPTVYSNNRVIGYGTTRGDGVMPVITATSAITMFTLNISAFQLEHLDINGNGSGSVGVSLTAASGVYKCRIRNTTGNGVVITSAGSWVIGNEFSGCGGTGAAIYINGTGNLAQANYIHDNTVSGIYVGSGSTAINNICAYNTGSSTDGIYSWGGAILNNDCYKNGRHGVRLLAFCMGQTASVSGNVLYGNSGYGLEMDSGSTGSVLPQYNYNAFGANTLGARSSTTTFPAGANDVTLTADPFVAAISGNFALNNLVGGGALLRAAGFPGTMPGGLAVGYQDIGAIQHKDPVFAMMT